MKTSRCNAPNLGFVPAKESGFIPLFNYVNKRSPRELACAIILYDGEALYSSRKNLALSRLRLRRLSLPPGKNGSAFELMTNPARFNLVRLLFPWQTRVAAILAALIWAVASLPTPGFAQEGLPAPKRSQPRSGPRKNRSPAVADPVVIDPQGFTQLLAKYRGKPLLVNFWATWCEPCRDEYPMLNELAQQYASQGLQIVGITLDDEGEMIMVRRFLKRYTPIFPNFRKVPGKEEEFINAVNKNWKGSIPATFFYARDGRQIGQIIGGGNRETLEAAIRSLLASGGKDSALSQP